MMNGILTALLIFSVVTAAFTGRMEALSAAALSGCGEAVSLVITLTGMLCLWSGLMEIARRCRLTEALARLLHPLPVAVPHGAAGQPRYAGHLHESFRQFAGPGQCRHSLGPCRYAGAAKVESP